VYFLIAIINSSLINYLFTTKFLNLAIKADYVKQISFPKPSIHIIKQLEGLSKIILKDKPTKKTEQLEKKIDILVYHLYKLTYEEACIIEGNSEWVSKEDYESYTI
jgi:hypothetical protein